jgi:hypothetical protein
MMGGIHSLDAIYNQSVVFGRQVLVLVDEGEVLLAFWSIAQELVELCDVLVELKAGLALFTVFCLFDSHTF